MRRIKSGDSVIVTTGKDKGRTGTVTAVLSERDRVVVEGINVAKKHVKANPQAGVPGGIQDKEMPIHVSNVMVVNPANGKGDRIGFRTNDDGKKERFFKSDGKAVEV